MPAAPFSPRGLIGRRLNGLATELCEKCGLASNAPHIRLLEELGISFILGCKKGDHKSLFEFVTGSERLGEVTHFTIEEGGVTHTFRFMNGVSLNDSNPDCSVNFIEYWEIKPNRKVQHFSWVTDIEVNKSNIMVTARPLAIGFVAFFVASLRRTESTPEVGKSKKLLVGTSPLIQGAGSYRGGE